MKTTNITSILNGQARLPCDISSPNLGERVILVLWFRLNSDTPIYSVDARDVEINRAGHWSAETAFGRRARFAWHETPSYLVVDGLVKEDKGVYRCRVDYRTSQTKNSLVNLTIIVPPSPPKILDENGNLIRSVAGPYLEGESLKLTCESKGGEPLPKLIWYRDGERWDTTDHSTLNGSTRNDVILARLRRDDLNTILSCEASNNNETVPASSFVLLDMLLAPLEVLVIEGRDRIYSANKEARFVCRSSGSRPPAAITWWLGGYRIAGSIDVVSQNGNSTTSTLSFILQTEHAGKLLVCRAENLRLKVLPLETATVLNMVYPPTLSVTFGKSLEGKSLKEGDDVYFECHVVANPAPLRVEWRHNGQRISQSVNKGVIINDRSLVLQKISRSQGGRYTCAAWNEEGGSESEPVLLNLQCKSY
ncbi:hemicentin-2-like isoform X2 [Artemia franciscana]|uniref:hemicentin-2-like isoform X2 n=1 Tax=Artemia franciscana TaxID=6661 RepID=UPI0032DB9E4D